MADKIDGALDGSAPAGYVCGVGNWANQENEVYYRSEKSARYFYPGNVPVCKMLKFGLKMTASSTARDNRCKTSLEFSD